jgi:hypothetical protein
VGLIAWTTAVQEALNLRVIKTFGDGFSAARISGLMQIVAPSTGDVAGGNKYSALILGRNLQMQRRSKDSDKRDIQDVNAYETRAQAANWQSWIQLSREDALFDNIGKLLAIADRAGTTAAEHPTRMVEAVVQLALEETCHTGKTYYADDHPVTPGSAETFANTDNLGDLDFASYDEAVAQFAAIPDEDGYATGAAPTILAVSAKYKEMGREITKNARPKDYSGGDNPRASDGVELIVVPSWPSEMWGLFDTSSPRDRAFAYAEAKAFEVSPIETDPNSAYAKKYNRIEWCVDGYAAVLIGNPRKSFLSVDPADVAAMLVAIKKKIDLNEFDFTLA